MRVLVIGQNGQLARALTHIADAGSLHHTSRDEIDLARPDTLDERLSAHYDLSRFDAIINAAAYTAVDQAETDEALAHTINADAPAKLAEVCARHALKLVHISTDYVFNGASERPWREDDTPAPINAYGRSKLAGEHAVLASHSDAIVLRTAWVYSPWGKNFLTTMFRLARDRDQLSIVEDQSGCPTSALDLARACLHMLIADTPPGLYHACGPDPMSWADFARTIFERALPEDQRPQITPIPTSRYPTPARRPAHSVLDTDKLTRSTGFVFPPLTHSLDEVVSIIRAQK